MSDEQQSTSEPAQSEENITLAQFLESVSPGQVREIKIRLAVQAKNQSGHPIRFRLRLPEIQLHCPSDTCNGERFFRADEEREQHLDVRYPNWNFDYVTYKCSNCQKQQKTFALALRIEIDQSQQPRPLQCYKFGELPAYGPPTPSRLISLLGPGRELFLKGRRCEIQGLGIGAFVYYRRVVEGQTKQDSCGNTQSCSDDFGTPRSD